MFIRPAAAAAPSARRAADGKDKPETAPEPSIPYAIDDPCQRQQVELIFQEGLARLKGRLPQIAEAKKRFERAGLLGHTGAMLELGHLHRKGLDGRPDYAEARAWYRRAAERGHPRGDVHLGLLSEKGLGAEPDMAEAIRRYRLAAERGDEVAQFVLGTLYEKGVSVKGVDLKKDYAKAANWYNKASAGGYAGARQNLRNLKRIWPEGFS